MRSLYTYLHYYLVIFDLFIEFEMAGTSMSVDEKLAAMDRKFTNMMENMNTALEKLSRSVESIQTGSGQRVPPPNPPPR